MKEFPLHVLTYYGSETPEDRGICEKAKKHLQLEKILDIFRLRTDIDPWSV